MAKIFGGTTTTPMNPDIFSGGGGSADLNDYYTKTETENIVETALENRLGDIETLLGGI